MTVPIATDITYVNKKQKEERRGRKLTHMVLGDTCKNEKRTLSSEGRGLLIRPLVPIAIQAKNTVRHVLSVTCVIVYFKTACAGTQHEVWSHI